MSLIVSVSRPQFSDCGRVKEDREGRSEQNVEKYVSICDGESQQAQRSKYVKKE